LNCLNDYFSLKKASEGFCDGQEGRKLFPRSSLVEGGTTLSLRFPIQQKARSFLWVQLFFVLIKAT